MSRNFTSDVDTQREYFNATYFNNSGQNQIAKYDTTLLKPFFPNPDQWKLAINRMRVPLSGIPLTRNNIPFQQWQVGMSYKTSSSATPTNQFSYVGQYNPITFMRPTNYNILNSSSGVYDIQRTKYNDLTVNDTDITTNIPSGSGGNYASRAIDFLAGTNGTIYTTTAISPGVNRVYCTDALTGQLYSNFDTTQQILSITTNPTTGDVYLYTTASGPNAQTYFYKFARTSPTSWANSTQWQNTLNPEYIFSNIVFANNMVMAIAQPDKIQFWDADGNYINFNVFNHWFNYAVAFNNLLYLYDYDNQVINVYNITSPSSQTLSIVKQSSISYNPAPLVQPIILGTDYYNNICVYKFTVTTDSYQFYNPANGELVNVQSTSHIASKDPVLIYPSVAEVQDVKDNPSYDIFTYQSFLNQMNTAFLDVFTQLKATLGASFLPTEPPSIIYNASNKLFSLVVEGQYLTTNPDKSNQYEIYMNVKLWDQFYFPSNDVTVSNTAYKSIILQNYGINAVVGTGSASLPQFIYVQQEDSTIYSFYDLVRIIVGTTLIPVSGDGEGKTFSNTGFSSNSAINMITDIVPDTTTLTPGSVLIYIPAGILRWYNLYAQQPFSRIDLILYYETKDGSVYPIQVINGEFFSVKLEFKKGPGDF